MARFFTMARGAEPIPCRQFAVYHHGGGDRASGTPLLATSLACLPQRFTMVSGHQVPRPVRISTVAPEPCLLPAGIESL